jgi:glycosyltransferase involved in cell wall biosynthesis
MKAARYAIVTPYYREPRATLERCIESVRRQTVGADHILVADGFPQDWLDDGTVNHLRLGQCHADFGNTPRGLGAMLAIAEHYEAIGFLDADNWYDADHVEACVAAAAGADADAVIARRRFVRYDGSVMDITDEPDHVDTSCFWLHTGALHVAPFWLMPSQLAPICDRVYYAMIKARRVKLGYVQNATVNYTCQYATLYRALGEPPPPGAKRNVAVTPICRWLLGLSERDRRLVALQCGVDLVPMALAAAGQVDDVSCAAAPDPVSSLPFGPETEPAHDIPLEESGAS